MGTSLQQNLFSTGVFIRGRQIKDIELSSMEIDGNFVSDCSFQRVDFSRTNFTGVRFENVEFEGCSLRNVDFKSCDFIGCRLSDCDISASAMIDGSLLATTLKSCSIPECMFSGNAVEQCEFIACSFSRATFTLCLLKETSFTDTPLDDCALEFNIFAGCVLNDSPLPSDVFTRSYGFDSAEAIETLAVELNRQKGSSLLQKAMCELNCSELPVSKGMATLAQYIAEVSERPRWSEIRFVDHVLHELWREQKLPALALIDMINELRKHCKSTALRDLGISTMALLQDMLAELKNITPIEHHGEFVIEVVFDQDPGADFFCKINDIAEKIIGTQDAYVLIGIRDGSFVAKLKTTALALALIQVIFFLLEGCVVQATSIRGRVQALASPDLPDAYKQLSMTPMLEIPEHLRPLMESMVSTFAGGAEKSRGLLKKHNSVREMRSTVH